MSAGPRTHWSIACRSGDIRQVPLAVTIRHLPLVIFRGQNGEAAVLEDRCRHRNAALSQGTVCKGKIRCAYHGWEYDSEGAVVNIPALPESGSYADSFNIRKFHAMESQGFVWVAPGAERPLDPPPVFAHFGDAGWTSFVMKTRFRASVEACLENFLDCPHATFVHRYWFRAPTATHVKAVVSTLDDGVIAEFFEEPREKSAVWWLLSPHKGTMRHTDRFIAPATSRVEYHFPAGRSYIITSSCIEINDDETDVYTVISFRYKNLGPLIRLVFEPLSRLVIRQDVDMLARQKKNIERFGRPLFTHTDADLLGETIVAWRRALKHGGEPPPAGTIKNVMIRL
jgi:phenylpropionate dioxygenase-like ring-hydroxylating dioxygenase large terminal subunit